MEIYKSVPIPVKQPKLFEVLLSSPWSTRARGLSRSARVCEKVFKFCPLAEKRGSLEGVRERGFNPHGVISYIQPASWYSLTVPYPAIESTKFPAVSVAALHPVTFAYIPGLEVQVNSLEPNVPGF